MPTADDPHHFDFNLDRGIRQQVVEKLEVLRLISPHMKKTIVLVFTFYSLMSASSKADQEHNEKINFGQLPNNYETVIRGYYSMPGHLLDPYSAVYRFAPPMKGMVQDGVFVGHKKHYGWIVPIWINAKNAFGGYAGAQRYYVMFYSENGNVVDVTEMFNLGRGKFLP